MGKIYIYGLFLLISFTYMNIQRGASLGETDFNMGDTTEGAITPCNPETVQECESPWGLFVLVPIFIRDVLSLTPGTLLNSPLVFTVQINQTL